jgi:16S rRNA (guanine966-N2)-methyltransferase
MVDFTDARVLDAYAGTGALGLEALSRGARSVDFVEKNSQAQRVIAQNIATLGVQNQTKIYKIGLKSFLGHDATARYDIALVDPPYNLLPKEFSTVFQLNNVVKNKGLMILSYPGRLCVPTVNGVVVVDNRRYGEAALAVFRFGA